MYVCVKVIGYGFWNDELSLDGGSAKLKAEMPYAKDDPKAEKSMGWGIRLSSIALLERQEKNANKTTAQKYST